MNKLLSLSELSALAFTTLIITLTALAITALAFSTVV